MLDIQYYFRCQIERKDDNMKRNARKNEETKKRIIWKKVVPVAISCMVIVISTFTSVKAQALSDNSNDKKTVICIDPGHGGETDGATYTYDEIPIYEKDLNLQIALKLEQELQKYENLEVVMTRREDITVELRERTQIAVDQNADYLISIHNNAAGNPELMPKGCMVLVTASHYQSKETQVPDIYEVSTQLGLSIVGKLQNLGLSLGNELGADSNSGLVRRPYSPEGGARRTYYYPDGSVSDYYALLRYGVEVGIPSIIIEHAYLSNEEDYCAYLATDQALELLAKADAEGIAEALNLTKKEVIEELTQEAETNNLIQEAVIN